MVNPIWVLKGFLSPKGIKRESGATAPGRQFQSCPRNCKQPVSYTHLRLSAERGAIPQSGEIVWLAVLGPHTCFYGRDHQLIAAGSEPVATGASG